jgi:hypothetical protein
MVNYSNPTFNLFIPSILQQTECRRHKVPVGTPCWVMFTVSGDSRDAICNHRAVSAGWNGKIDPVSMLTKARNFGGKHNAVR